MGADASAETGPLPVVSPASGAARRALTEQLFAAQYPKLAGWIRRLVDDDDTAHEIASEAFVRLMSKWTSPEKLDNPQSYLYMIATNLVRDYWRKTQRERRAIRNVAAATGQDTYPDPASDVVIRELLEKLPPRLRDPFLLHYYAGFGIHEISLLLKRPDGTIKADLFQARARLKEALAERGARAGAGPAAGQRDASAKAEASASEASGKRRGRRRANVG